MLDPLPEEAQRQALLALARQLVARLERLSADSFWAHRASGLRGALLRALELADSGAPLTRLKRLVEQGHQVLTNAAREIEEPR